MNKYDIYVPSNILNFKCSMCGACCKRNWSIYLNKNEYDRIKNLYCNKGLGKIFEESFTLTGNNNPEEYSKVNYECDQCKFLDEHNLCSHQIQNGMEALCATCARYPKNYEFSKRGIEVCMYYSCNTSIKTLDTDIPITIVKNPNNFSMRFDREYKNPETTDLEKFYFSLEDFLLKVLQNRNLTIQERLAVLEYIVENTLNLGLNEKDLPALLNVAENAQKIMESSELINNLVKREGNNVYQIAYLLSTLKNKDNKFKLIEDVLKDIEDLFSLNEWKNDIEKITTDIMHNYEKFYKSYEKNFENIIENYLCQQIFRREFSRGFLNGFFITSLYYSLLRFFSIYLCVKHNKSFDKEILFEAIKTTELGFAHNGYIVNALKEIWDQRRIDIPSVRALYKM